MIDLTTEDVYIKRVGNLCSDCSVLTASILSDINQVFYGEGISGDLSAANLSVRYVTGQEYHDLVMGISGTFEPKTVYVISNDTLNFYAALDEKRNINDLQYGHDEWQLETNDGDTAILVKSGNMYVGNSTKYFPQQYALLYAGNDNWQLAAPQFSTYLAKIAAETTYKLVFQRDDITFTVSRGDMIALMSQVITSNDISTCMHYYHPNEMPEPPHVGDSTFLNGIYSIYDGEEWRSCTPDTIPAYITDSNGNAISADRSCVDVIPMAETVWHIEADITTPFVSHYEGDATYNDGGWSYTDPFGDTIYVGGKYDWQHQINGWRVSGAMTFANPQTLSAIQILVDFQVDGDKFTESIVHDNITLTRTVKTNTKLATVSQVDSAISGKADLSALELKQDQLSAAQMMAIDLDAEVLYTQVVVDSEWTPRKFLAATNTLTKQDFADAGLYDMTNNVWLHVPKGVQTGSNVTIIDTNLFNGCTELQTFIGQNVQEVKSQAFNGCTALARAELPNLVRMGISGCKDCTSLTSLVMPPSIVNVGRNAFTGCFNITVHFEEKSLAEVQGMENYPWGLNANQFTADKTATQNWVDSAISSKADVSALNDYIMNGADTAIIQDLTCDNLIANAAYIEGYAKSSDLSGKADLSAVGNGTITLTQGGVTKGTFTTNQSATATIDLDAGGGGGSGYMVNFFLHGLGGMNYNGPTSIKINGQVLYTSTLIQQLFGATYGSSCQFAAANATTFQVEKSANDNKISMNGQPCGFGEVTLTGDALVIVTYDTCLSPDTLILMSDGTAKMIADMNACDMVMTPFGADTVTKVSHGEGDTIDVWTFADGTVVKTIGRHRFYNCELGEPMYLEAWKIGEHALTPDGNKIALVSHAKEVKPSPHWTIFTKKYNLYYANGLLAGNRHSCRYGNL